MRHLVLLAEIYSYYLLKTLKIKETPSQSVHKHITPHDKYNNNVALFMKNMSSRISQNYLTMFFGITISISFIIALRSANYQNLNKNIKYWLIFLYSMFISSKIWPIPFFWYLWKWYHKMSKPVQKQKCIIRYAWYKKT